MAIDVDTVATAVVSFLTALGAKIGYDKVQKNKVQAIEEEVQLDKPFSTGQTVAVWMTNQIHKVKNDLDPHFGRLNLNVAELTIKLNKIELELAHAKGDIATNKADVSQALADLHRHIDASTHRLEEGFKREIDRFYEFQKRP